jgi:outer membrane protein TolC
MAKAQGEAPATLTGTAPAVSIAQEVEVSLRSTAELVAAVQLAGEDAVTILHLDEVIALALSQNRALLVAAYDPEIAQESLRSARAEFDPALSAGASYRRVETDQQRERSLLEWTGFLAYERPVDVNADIRAGDAGVGGKLPTGLRYQAALTHESQDSDVSVFGANGELLSRGAVVTLSQPLLRGAGLRVNRAEIRKAEAALDARNAEFYLQQQNIVAEAIAAYWQLVGAYAALAVRQAAVRTADQLLSDTLQRNELGAVSDLDTLTAQAGLARRQNDLINAVATLGAASDRLKALLELRAENGLETALLAPAAPAPETDLETLPLDPTLEPRLERALAQRPELFIADADRRIAALTALQRRNARLPQLDLAGEVGRRDTGEDYNGVVLGDRDEDTDYWSLGLHASIPIGNRRARAEARAAQRREEQSQTNYEAVKTAVMEDLRHALRDARKSAVLVENARKTVAIERARFQAEQERFLFGANTAFQVLLVQDDLVAEETRLAAAEAELLAQLANLERAEGTLLTRFGYPAMDAGSEAAPQ